MASSKVEITVQIPRFDIFMNLFNRNLTKASEEIKARLLVWARDTHRTLGGVHYTDQSGDLRRATKVEGDIKSKIEMYVDHGMVEYGRFILSGQRNDPRSGVVKWNNGVGDNFLEKAFNANKEWIMETVEKYTKNAIVEFDSIPLEEL